jgi:S-formylglutathione hydrolase FrmB
VKNTVRLIAALLVPLLVVQAGRANSVPRPWKLDRINRKLHGTLIDHTSNHGVDRRIWSAALCQKRDLYVYLPPGFDPSCRYPICLWLHGFASDEHSFAADVIEELDAAIACGKIPPMIIAAPDGSLNGHPCLVTAGSFFVNSDAGRFEDFLVQDVWGFLCEHYPIRPEREAHVLAGVSMGGGAACALGMKHRDLFAVCVCVFPPLNTRYIDCHCRYLTNFDPCCVGWRTDYSRRNEVIARFYGVIPIRMKRLIGPLYGFGPEVAGRVAKENPAELLDRLNIQPHDLAIYIGYGAKDEFNIDAQVESFLALARPRGICPTVVRIPEGRHNHATAQKLSPSLLDWLGKQMAPYFP